MASYATHGFSSLIRHSVLFGSESILQRTVHNLLMAPGGPPSPLPWDPDQGGLSPVGLCFAPR